MLVTVSKGPRNASPLFQSIRFKRQLIRYPTNPSSVLPDVLAPVDAKPNFANQCSPIDQQTSDLRAYTQNRGFVKAV